MLHNDAGGSMLLALSRLHSLELRSSLGRTVAHCGPCLRPQLTQFPTFARYASVPSRLTGTTTTKPQKDLDQTSKSKNEKVRGRIAERDFFLSVLNASATKRDAKSYLSQFKPEKSQDSISQPRAKQSLVSSSQASLKDTSKSWPLHIALVKIRAPQDIDDVTIDGLAQTLSQLTLLGLSNVIVLDCDDGEVKSQDAKSPSYTWRKLFVDQADRMVSALQHIPLIKAARLDSVLAVTPSSEDTQNNSVKDAAVDVQFSDVLRTTLNNGYIPVIPAIGYTTQSQRAVAIDSDQVMLALTREFVRHNEAENQLSNAASKQPNFLRDKVTVDRIIVLDPLGGIPSMARGSHVFINMKQEYGDIRQELMEKSGHGHTLHEDYIASLRHVKNLDLLQQALTILPPSSSALLATPAEAATLSHAVAPEIGVGTRRPKNPLIFNLLTDKPLVSSSLPVARVSQGLNATADKTSLSNPSTFLKLGLPLTMIPDPRHEQWEAPMLSKGHIKLNDDPRIDFPRLVNLIEDSFNRPLDVEDYLRRIQNKLAGVIIAGDYEGGAILTWELPAGVPDDASEESRRRMVPYLDKFAVLKRSQGSGGVADVVFSAMVRSCFPQGVCWRSRKNNPVNKWYFERSVGTFKLPECNWTMFWTTEGLTNDKQRFMDYENVCRKVMPSWLDQKAMPS